MTTGQRIKEARKNAGLTQKELADKLGIPYQSIGQWERDQRNPKLITLKRIADALKTTPRQMLGDHWDIYINEEIWGNGMTVKLSPDNSVFAGILMALDQLDYNDRPQMDGERIIQLIAEMILALSQLNPDGQQQALERIKELSEIPKYQKTPPQDEAQDGEKGDE